jgi:hypothetical protein
LWKEHIERAYARFWKLDLQHAHFGLEFDNCMMNLK